MGINSKRDVEALAAAVVEGFARTGDQPRADLVIHDLTQDDEETEVSLATTTEGEGTPVRLEVRNGGRVEDATNRGGRVPRDRGRYDPLRPTQRPTRNTISPRSTAT